MYDGNPEVRVSQGWVIGSRLYLQRILICSLSDFFFCYWSVRQSNYIGFGFTKQLQAFIFVLSVPTGRSVYLSSLAANRLGGIGFQLLKKPFFFKTIWKNHQRKSWLVISRKQFAVCSWCSIISFSTKLLSCKKSLRHCLFKRQFEPMLLALKPSRPYPISVLPSRTFVWWNTPWYSTGYRAARYKAY